MKEYLQGEWKFNNLPKYQHLFESWFSNLTQSQILYFRAYSKGQKTSFIL